MTAWVRLLCALMRCLFVCVCVPLCCLCWLPLFLNNSSCCEKCNITPSQVSQALCLVFAGYPHVLFFQYFNAVSSQLTIWQLTVYIFRALVYLEKRLNLQLWQQIVGFMKLLIPHRRFSCNNNLLFVKLLKCEWKSEGLGAAQKIALFKNGLSTRKFDITVLSETITESFILTFETIIPTDCDAVLGVQTLQLWLFWTITLNLSFKTHWCIESTYALSGNCLFSNVLPVCYACWALEGNQVDFGSDSAHLMIAGMIGGYLWTYPAILSRKYQTSLIKIEETCVAWKLQRLGNWAETQTACWVWCQG